MSLTHLDGLKVDRAEPGYTGGTVLQCTGTLEVIGKIAHTGHDVVTGSLSLSNTAYLAGDLRIASQANGICGRKTILAGSVGSGVINSSKIGVNSRILLTPCSGTIRYPIASVRAVGTGTASVRLNQLSNGTNATASGRLYYQIINI